MGHRRVLLMNTLFLVAGTAHRLQGLDISSIPTVTLRQTLGTLTATTVTRTRSLLVQRNSLANPVPGLAKV